MKGWIAFLCVAYAAVVTSCRSAPEIPARSDWADVVLQATGVAFVSATGESSVESRLLAIQDAKVDAYNKLEEKVRQLSINEHQRVVNLVEEKPLLSERIRRYVRRARIVSTRMVAERQMEVSAELFLGENFKELLGLVRPKRDREKQQPQMRPPRNDLLR